MTGTETVPVDVPNRHVETDITSDWMTVRANGEIVVIHEPDGERTTAYTLGNRTKNPRVMATASAMLWEGTIAKTAYEERELVISHPVAGVQERLPIDVLLDEPVPTLERTELVQLEGVGGRVEFECSDCGDHIVRERHQMDIPGVTPQRCTSCTFDRMGES